LAIRLTPQDQAFYELLAAGGENLAAAAAVLCGLLQPDADRQAIADQMRDLEHAGDAVTHQILRQLNTSFVTPFDREDIYALAGRVDDVMDDLQKDLFRAIFATHSTDEATIQRAVQIALVGRYFERMADHAVNVAERVTFMVTGQFRHEVEPEI
jgi:uncharacterized protein Yka (UPF0111/DUF47 family)